MASIRENAVTEVIIKEHGLRHVPEPERELVKTAPLDIASRPAQNQPPGKFWKADVTIGGHRYEYHGFRLNERQVTVGTIWPVE